jgi:hypothetical protein
MKKTSTLSILDNLNSWLSGITKLISDYRDTIEKCNYKNKDKYLTFLSCLEIPQIFCIEDNKTITYKMRGQILTKTLKNMAGIWNPPITLNPSEKGKLTAISSIHSGKKQEAVKVTALKRRMEDGTYKGSKETIKTRESLYDWSEVTTKIAEIRKNGDGYKNNPRRLTIEKVTKILKELHPDYILVSQIYEGNKKKLQFLCDKKHYFEMRWNSIASGQSCPSCVKFIQEDKVREIIERIFGEKFVKIRPEWLINPNTNRRLELDGYCDKIKVAFEYDGEFHYEIHDTEEWKENVRKIKIKDRIKDSICKKEGVFLIRISFKVKDREKYIRKQYLKWLKSQPLKK